MITAHVYSFVLICTLSGYNLGVLDYHLNIQISIVHLKLNIACAIYDINTRLSGQ